MKKTKSIFFRNFTSTILVLVISFALLGAAFTTVTYRYVIDRETQSMHDSIHQVGRLLSAYVTEWGSGGLEVRAALSMFSDTSGYDLVLADENGVVVSCSDKEKDCHHIGKSLPGAIVDTAARGEYFGKADMSELYGETRHAAAISIASIHGDNILGYVVLSAASEDMSQIWRQFAGIFFVTALAIIAITSALTYVSTKHQTDPIKRMADAAHRFGYGDFSVRVDNSGDALEIKELADAFNVMADSLERSEQTWRDLIANVAHELKTPMTTITGFADGILDGTIPEAREKDYLQVISSETKRLNRLVRGMLQMSRVQDKNQTQILNQSFDITEVIRKSLLSLEGKITDRDLDVDVSLPEEAVFVRGDEDSITQVVYNLIDNAAKFADRDSMLNIALWKKENKAYVSVEDHGITIPREELPLIFERFQKADKSRGVDKEGVGLGLYIVKMIINRHNEDIFVTSEDGITRFVFTMTLTPQQKADK